MTPKLTVATRKRIKKMLDSGVKPKFIAEKVGCTINQVNNVKYAKSKTEDTPRADKGLSRGKITFYGNINANGITETSFDNIEDFLEAQLEIAAEDLSNRKMTSEERIKIVESITRILKNIDQRRLSNHIKRPDAEIIIRIMRRFNPDLTDEEIIKIYHEELEKLQRDLK